MTILERIAELRERDGGISVNRLEKETGIARGSISKWGDHIPSYDRVKKVADYFGVTPEYILTGKEKKPDVETTTELDALERDLIRVFRQIPEDRRSEAIALLKAALRIGQGSSGI